MEATLPLPSLALVTGSSTWPGFNDGNAILLWTCCCIARQHAQNIMAFGPFHPSAHLFYPSRTNTYTYLPGLLQLRDDNSVSLGPVPGSRDRS